MKRVTDVSFSMLRHDPQTQPWAVERRPGSRDFHRFRGMTYGRLVVASGVVGTVVALIGVADRLIDFLVLLGLVVPPIAAVYLTDYFILRRRDYAAAADAKTNINALLACFVGAAMGIVMYYTHSSLSGVATIESFITAGIGYWSAECARRACVRDRLSQRPFSA